MTTARKTQKLRVALIQFDTKKTLEDTLKHLTEVVQKTYETYNPQIISLQEGFNYFYQSDKKNFVDAGESLNGTTSKYLSALARKYSVFFIAGIAERTDGKLYNTALVFNPNGELVARHRKVNLCDIKFENGTHLDEVSAFTPGDDITTFQIDDVKVGVCICWDACYDEFIKLYRKVGCDILFVPAAYDIDKSKSVTLDYYWELVHRARAFDNQFYVAAISGAQNDNIKDYVLYGHTMIIDPFGRILKQAGTKEEIVYQELDLTYVDKIRDEFPTFRLRRKDLYAKYANM